MHLLLKSVSFWIFAILGVMLTAFYMFRLFYLVFSGKSRGNADEKHPPHESPSVMTVPLMVLAVLSVIGGFVNIPKIFAGSEGLDAFLAPVFADASRFVHQRYHINDPFNEVLIMAVPLVFSAIMIILAFQRFFIDKKIMDDRSAEGNIFSNIASRRFYVDEIYDFLFVRPVLWLSRILHDLIELKFIDRGVNGIGTLVVRMGNTIRYVQTGHVGFYLFIMVFGIIAILLFNILFF